MKQTASLTAEKLVTAEDLFALPRGRQRHELNDGVLRTMSPAGFEHGCVANKLSVLLSNHVAKHDLGVVAAAETGYLLKRDPDLIRAPDASFIARTRIPETGLPEFYWSGAPDLAVEVNSPNDTVREVSDKVRVWLKAGTRMVWVVDPRLKTITSYRSLTEAVVLTEKDDLDGGDVVPGFRCKIAQVF